MTTKLNDLSSAIFSSLRAMDAEATTRYDGEPTGLSYYGAHACPERPKPTEPAWSKRIGALLTQAGFQVAVERSYPDQPTKKKARCDVVVQFGPGKLWLEVKGAWRDYWVAEGNLWIYRSYLLHPLVPGLDGSKTHTVPLDLLKLAQLSPKHASAVGMLLVGFEKDGEPMDSDVAELVRLAKLDEAPWTAFADRWPAAHVPRQSVRCWMWVKFVGADGLG